MAMNIDPSRLQGLDEATLAGMIYDIVRSMGMGEEKARAAAASAGQIKKTLENADERQIRRILSMVGDKRATEILEKYGR